MNTDNHERFTRQMFNGLGIPWSAKSEVMAKRINHNIDNSNVFLNAFNKMQNDRYANTLTYGKKNPYDFFNLTGGGGHRTVNHDIMSGSLIAAMNARALGMPFRDGLMMAYSHYAADNVSNHLVKSMGVEGKNLFESLYSWTTRKRKW
jgi:hypothetical protein